MPAIPNRVSPSIPGPWWGAMVSYIVATCLTAVLLGILIWWWFSNRTRKAIVEFSISRHADTAQEIQEVAGWTPPGSSTAGHKEHTETETLGSNGDNGNGEGTSKVEAGSREEAPRYKGA
ncbi:uncharacterized protein BO88DRAFT_413486 [Aspergillus vadensis CBS 113365]|uniref:Uncharacterized protein n=1 Tax=Aspergillus vadensis (strain CBS 113365 / IMI 142717 / IBT 24658) TaxID=1448311 RepID=A0A319BGU1_ASPVC|nr:hypothetical protein BO88DRAFT_413486 [Aspergillus vadensis CBS 113365]PYH71324.1 hypothetical protein BO88DRAFT_413486 [Aspergillus vadensis CBS 113365]